MTVPADVPSSYVKCGYVMQPIWDLGQTKLKQPRCSGIRSLVIIRFNTVFQNFVTASDGAGESLSPAFLLLRRSLSYSGCFSISGGHCCRAVRSDILLQLLSWFILQRVRISLKTNFLFLSFWFYSIFYCWFFVSLRLKEAFHIENGFRYPWQFYQCHLINKHVEAVV